MPTAKSTIPDLATLVTDEADNCTTPTLTQTPTATTKVTLAHNGTTMVTIKADDGNGNTIEKMVTLTAKDGIDPTFTAPANRDAALDANCQITIPDLVTLVTDEADNCTTPTLTQTPTATTKVTLAHNGTTMVTIKADDGNGNTTEKMVTLTAKDGIRPDIQTASHTITLNANSNYTLTTSDLATLGAGTTDNCTDFANLTFMATPNTFNCSDIGQQTISLTAIDAGNNASAVANATLTVIAPPSQLSLVENNVQVLETDGTINVDFTLQRSNAVCATTVNFATQNGSATAGSDYVAQTGMLHFLAGETTKTLSIQLTGDTDFENNETLRVHFSNPTNNHSLIDDRFIITILDDDTRNTVLDFDGVDDQVVVDNVEIPTGFTLEFWMNYAGQQQATEAILSHNSGAFVLGFEEGKLRLFNTSVQMQSAFPTNVWKHVVLSINSSGRIGSLYLDGALVSSEFPLNPEYQTNTGTAIVGTGNGFAGMSGKLDEVRLWHQVRSATEITSQRQCELTGIEEDLALYFNFNDAIPNGNNTNKLTTAGLVGEQVGQLMGFDLIGLQSNFLKTNLDLTTNCATALDLAVIDLLAKVADNQEVKLTWQATSEQQISHYEVERSADGKVFASLGRVAANQQSTYQFLDTEPFSTTNYYRIRAVENTGTTTVSKTQLVTLTATAAVQLFPNPTTGIVQIKSSEKITGIRVLDALGRLVQTRIPVSDTFTPLDLSAQAAGVYFIAIETPAQRVVQRIVKE